MPEIVHTIRQRLDGQRRADVIDRRPGAARPEAIERVGSPPPTVDVLDALMEETRLRVGRDQWADRSTSDGWLAPRLHYALRLHRLEAADRGVWQWLAVRHAWYVAWRWSDGQDAVAEDRWFGAVNKQAFARLWWGAELFRDGSDYTPVERAFVFQDLPNSLLHRPIVRCRSLALAVVERFADRATATSADVNGLARVLNLTTVGSPPEAETAYQVDDDDGRARWVTDPVSVPDDWDVRPVGPTATDTSRPSLEGGREIVARGWRYACLD